MFWRLDNEKKIYNVKNVFFASPIPMMPRGRWILLRFCVPDDLCPFWVPKDRRENTITNNSNPHCYYMTRGEIGIPCREVDVEASVNLTHAKWLNLGHLLDSRQFQWLCNKIINWYIPCELSLLLEHLKF